MTTAEQRRQWIDALQAYRDDSDRLFGLVASLANLLDRELVIETMESVLARTGVVLMDNENANSLMYLPIDQLMKQVPGMRQFSGSNSADNESQNDTEGEQTVRPTRRSREAR